MFVYFCLLGGFSVCLVKNKRLCDSSEFILCQILFADRGGRFESNTISLNALFLVSTFCVGGNDSLMKHSPSSLTSKNILKR